MENEVHEVIVQIWEESERNWGKRPDGFSLHLTEADRKSYVEEYWDRMPNEVPHTYSRPVGTPYKAEVDAATFAKVKASKNGIRGYDDPPGSGG